MMGFEKTTDAVDRDQPAASRWASAQADQYAQLPGWVGGLFPGFSQSLRLAR